MRAALVLAIAVLVAALPGCARPSATSEEEPMDPAGTGEPARDAPISSDSASARPSPDPGAPATPQPPTPGGTPGLLSSVPVPPPRPRVVVAVVDSDLNFYHAEFAREGPGVLIPGVAMHPIELTLGAGDRAAAEKADHGMLMGMETGKLYAFPGTKVAAISFVSKDGDWPLVLNKRGTFSHGTMTASRATGNTVSLLAGEPDVDLVFVQGISADAVRWAAEQPWIDVISVSSSASAVTIAPGAGNALDGDVIEAFVEASHRKPLFLSVGNGVGNAGVAGFPSWLRGASGAADAISVGANDNDYYAHWANQDPYVSADGCANPVAADDETSGVQNTGGGTSSATPFAAGGGARLILEARRLLGDLQTGPRETGAAASGWDSLAPADATVALAVGPAGLVATGPLVDGVFTLRELKDVLYHTALALPTSDATDGEACATSGHAGNAYFVIATAESVPAPARFAAFGYGEVNVASVEAGMLVLRGSADLPVRADDDLHYARAHAMKSTLVG